MGAVCASCEQTPPLDQEAIQELAASLSREIPPTPRPPDGVNSQEFEEVHVISEEEQKLFLRVVDKLEENDEFLANDSDSEAGDLAVDNPTDMDYGDDRELYYDSKLEDPAIEDWELVNAWTKIRHHKLPDKELAERMIKAVTKLHAGLPNVVEIPRPEPGQHLVVVGDLHGHFGDLLHILDVQGEPREGAGGTIYIFNGDFVDRGAMGPEVLLGLYCLKLRFPGAVHLNRGNHEDVKMNALQGNGFRDFHCVRAFGQDAKSMYRLIRRSFLCLPLVYVIGKEIVVIHGGLPLDPGVTLAEINKIYRKRDVPIFSSSCLGYPAKQAVVAKKALVSKQGQQVPAGTTGHIVQKVMKSRSVEVLFEGGALVHAEVFGAPDLEQELTVVYPSEKEKQFHRLDRLFVALLWSDPIEAGNIELPGPNTGRGAGSKFDASATDNFLRTNSLQCLLRSHQKRGDGFQIEHSHSDKPSTITVFSASNYSEGADLSAHANLANVAVFTMNEELASQPLLAAMKPAQAWSDSHHGDDLEFAPAESSGIIRMNSLSAFAKRCSEEDRNMYDSEAQRVSARQRALQQLWLLIYCYRPELVAFFLDHDKEDTGKVNLTQWASIMRGCLIPDASFPWEELAPHLANFDKQGMCHYHAFLMRFKNKLSARLESHWCKRALARLFVNLGEGTQAEAKWKELDRNGDGELSYSELRPLLKEHLTFNDGEDTADEAVYSLLANLDKNGSGYVEKNEFLDAVNRGKQYQQEERRGDRRSGQEGAVVDQCWVFLHNTMRALAKKHTSASVLFRFLDTDHDGMLTRAEFKAGLNALLPKGGDHKAVRDSIKNWEPLLWALIDTDGSGNVSQEELQEALYVKDAVTNGMMTSRTSDEAVAESLLVGA